MPDETKQPPQSTELWQALFNVQQKLGGILKDSTNPHFKNDYADRTTILQTLKPLFAEEGLLLIQAPVVPSVKFSDEPVLALATSIVHVKTSQQLSSTAIVPLPKADPQGFGSALTYTSRYSLVALLGIPLLDDDGNSGSNLGAPRQQAAKIGPKSDIGTASKSAVDAELKTGPTAKPEGTQTSASGPTTGTPPVAANGTRRKLWGNG